MRLRKKIFGLAAAFASPPALAFVFVLNFCIALAFVTFLYSFHLLFNF